MKLPWGPTALNLRVSLTILKISPLRVHHFKKIPQDMGCEKGSLIAKGLAFGLIAIPKG